MEVKLTNKIYIEFRKSHVGTYVLYIAVSILAVLIFATLQMTVALEIPFYKLDKIAYVVPIIVGAIFGSLIARNRILNQQQTQYISALKHAETKLKAAKAEAEAANLFKTQFLYRMSHELRTPMNAVLGFGSLLKIDDTLTVDQKSSVQEILNGGNHIMELINDLLDLSRIEAGKLECSPEDCDLNNILNECVSFIAPLAAKHNIQMINNITTEANHTIYIDPTRFKQVMLNLLSNAVKYNNDNGTVTLSCDVVDDNYIRINISDTGNGLTEQERQSLFIPFERMGEHRGIEGTGIGLIITRHLVELMGGSIGAESEIEKGSNFWIQVPLS